MTVVWQTLPDGSRMATNDDPFVRLDDAAKAFGVTAGHIRELLQIEPRIRRRTLRLVEDRWLVEHYLVSAVDVARVPGDG